MELTRTEEFKKLEIELENNENNELLLDSIIVGRKVRLSLRGDYIIGTVESTDLLSMTVSLKDVEWTYRTVIEDGSALELVSIE